MSNNAEVVFTGNAKGLLDEYKKLEKANEQLSQKLLAAMKVSKQAANEETKLRKEVTAAIEKSKTPAEAYIQTINRYKQALQSGMITAEQFNRIRDVELSKLNASKAALDKNTASVRALNSEQQVGTGATSKFADGFAMIATKVLAATVAVRAFLAEKKRMQDEAEGTVASIDELSRDYAIQGGLKTEDQRKAASARIMKVARDNASTAGQAFGTASQLASSGFDAPEGESLDSALKIIKTSDMAKADPKGYIDAAAKYLKASNQKLTGKNLLGIGVAMRGLVDTPVQASDLAEFSEAAPVLDMQGVDWKTGLGMMTELRRAFSGATAGTKMRNIAQRLSAATSKDAEGKPLDKPGADAIQELGLNPQDVDAIGESMPEALRRISKAVAAQPIEKRAGIMGRIFNNENVAAADVLMKNLDGVDKNVAAMSDSSMFTAGVNFQLQGHNAEKNRAELDKQQKQLEDADATTRRTILLKEVEINRIDRARRQGIGKNVIDSIYQAKDEVMYGIGAVSDEELLQRSQTGVQMFPGWESEQQRNQAMGRLNKSGTTFTDADLQTRMNGGAAGMDSAPIVDAINKQTSVLSGKLTPPAKPTVNPNLQGRP